MSHNGLKLNEDKTEWIIFNGCDSDISENVTLTVGAHSVAQSTHIRSLGVRLDAKLTIEPQITDICKTAYNHIKKMNKIRKYLTDDTTKTLVHSLVTGRLDYCNSLYFGLASKSIYKLQLAQNSAARIISKTRKHEHISPIFEKLHWLPINKRAVYKRMVLTFNSLHRNGPAYIKTALNWYTPLTDLRSRNIPSLIPVKSRSIRINNRLLQGGRARQWNSLSKSIKCAASLAIFKKTTENISFHAAMTLLIDYIQW